MIWSKTNQERCDGRQQQQDRLASGAAQEEPSHAEALEIARFTVGHDKIGETQKTIDEIARKIAESEKCISAYEQQTRRPLGTDFRSLTSVSWGHWNAHTNQR